MRGKNSRLTALQARKQLLLAESELNRQQMLHDWEVMAGEVRNMAMQSGTIGSLASNAAFLMAGLTAFQGKKSAPSATKTSWLQAILKGSGLVSTLWLALRPKQRRNSRTSG